MLGPNDSEATQDIRGSAMQFVVYVNHRVRHAMIHYADSGCSFVSSRSPKKPTDAEGWSERFSTFCEAKLYAAREEPRKRDTRLCFYCERLAQR